jgi:outer membrane biosynthesis protein TonB
MIAVYQVLVVTAILFMHNILMFFIATVKRDSISFVLVSRKRDVQQDNLEEQQNENNELGWKTQLWHDRQAPPSVSRINGFVETDEKEQKEPVKEPVKEPIKEPVKEQNEPLKEQKEHDKETLKEHDKETVKEHEHKHDEREQKCGKKRQ